MAIIKKIETGTDFQSAMEMAELLRKNGEVTHGIMIYRTANGDLNYRLFAESASHITYVFGMLERVKMWLYAHSEWLER